MTPTTQRAVLVLALLQCASFPAEVFAAVRFSPPYDWVSNTISDLGARSCTSVPYPHGNIAVCSPLNAVMNGAMLLGGAALIVLTITARRVDGFRGTAGAAWVISGLSTMLTGLVPLDVDPVLHVLVSTPVFIASPIAVLLGAFQKAGALRGAGAAVGAASLFVGALFLVSHDLSAYGGLLERLSLWPPILWVLLLVLTSSSAPEVQHT